MSGGITYDNFLVTRDEAAAEAFGVSTWQPKHSAQESAASAEKETKDRDARIAAAAAGGWLEKATYWAGEATAIAKSQPVATAVTAVSLLALLIALIFFGCPGAASDATPHVPPIFEPEDERAASAAALQEAHESAAPAAPVAAVTEAPVAAEIPAPETSDSAPSSSKSAGRRKAVPGDHVSEDSPGPASSTSEGARRRSTRNK